MRDCYLLQQESERWLTAVEVAGVDSVVDDAVLVELVIADLHLDLEELVLPACFPVIKHLIRIIIQLGDMVVASWKPSKGIEADLVVVTSGFDAVLLGRTSS